MDQSKWKVGGTAILGLGRSSPQFFGMGDNAPTAALRHKGGQEFGIFRSLWRGFVRYSLYHREDRLHGSRGANS